ncbi:metal-sensitive transcriptional regulator [Patescibacteria group bacterium]|nr:metal-sensitive transcriptional regulator [Patescibacteria group bacterium]
MPTDPIVTKLNRVKGQIEGIVKMYEDERQCVDVVRQVIAARNSLSSIARELLTDEASACSKQRRTEDLENILKEIFKY